MGRWVGFGFFCLLVSALTVAGATADQPVQKTEASPKKVDQPDKKVAEPSPKKDEAAKPAPATQTVKKGPLKITVELDGVFEAEAAEEISVRPDEWTAMAVRKAVAHGARVRKGDVLLELETEKLDRAIAELQTDVNLGALALQQSGDQLKALEKTTPLDLDAWRRAALLAEEDQRYYFDVGRPFTVKATEFTLKSARLSLEYEQEELRQLEKMYKADDITEETEAIVLQRARDTVERAKFALETAQISRDCTMKYDIPRRDVTMKESTQRTLLESEKNRIELPLALRRQGLELEKLRWEQSQNEAKLKRLLADREGMTVRSPIDGIVYHGKLSRGKPADSATMADALRPGGAIQPNQVVMTVVAPRPMFIRATAPEANLRDLRPGLKGIATPEGYSDLRLPATLDATSDIPISPGMFDARFGVDLKEKTKLLVPGMTCKVKMTVYLKPDALTVPLGAIVDDEIDDQKHSVEVLEKDGATKSRPVVLGRKTDKRVEIVEGLAEGEQIVTEPAKK